ncbi:accessory Sec system S-layer assembly protein [Peribacillus glennii]|uniref:Accessory Sec system S-layer assembly protein n=1 Tax=Peribacillus glennii TaxID=2303991 RepID=A0A372LD99_9BACI|nr:accessory Sec system S-layer assembly protein [Peribacillus glennii]RFU63979.1 accessory Sec system S-layer assembly protein [Peribacillus glennii]
MGLFRRKAKAAVQEPEQQEVQNPIEETGTKDHAVYTTLTFHEEWDLEAQEKYVYRFRHQQLPPLNPNQISISGIRLVEYDNDVVVVAFIRNSLEKAVRFEHVDLLLLDEQGRPLAKKQFDLSDIGEIPPMSAMPWRFLFEETDILSEDIPQEGWKIAFELKAKPQEHKLDLDISWENSLSEVQRERLEQLVSDLPKLNPGEVNFMGIEAGFMEDRSFAVTVLIRNGSEKQIKIEKLPLAVEDADGDVICQGGFTLDDFFVKAQTSKPRTFIFPAQLMAKQNPNLRTWKVYPPS